jgi:aspartyl-tRNA(Asn)/glutamyl-tRNA(Gln) amidotransferase subunit C
MYMKREQIAHIAKLARLRLTRDQEALFTKQLSQVLEYMEILNKVDTHDVEPTFRVITIPITFREDKIKHSQSKDANLSGPHQSNGDYFVVPKVI